MQYIKIQCIGCRAGYQMRLYDVSIKGTLQQGQNEPPISVIGKQPVNISQGKTATASSNENQIFVPENVLDGDMNTRWSSVAEDDQWITIDLEDNYVIKSLNLYWEAAYASNFSVYMSTDGITWNLAGNYDISEPGQATLNYNNKIARYIKIQGNTRATQYGISLYEVDVYGYN